MVMIFKQLIVNGINNSYILYSCEEQVIMYCVSEFAAGFTLLTVKIMPQMPYPAQRILEIPI